MANIDLNDKERASDDAWTAPKLMILAVVTLVLALSTIWALGAHFAPPGY